MGLLTRIAEGIILNSGQPVPPAILQQMTAGKKSNNLFSALLNQTGTNTTANTALNPPTPPTPPTDLNNAAALQQYHYDLLAYNQQFQAYHARMMTVFNQRFLQMQQQMMRAQQQQSAVGSNSSTGLGISSDTASVGGII